jgi:hypothetical protein
MFSWVQSIAARIAPKRRRAEAAYLYGKCGPFGRVNLSDVLLTSSVLLVKRCIFEKPCKNNGLKMRYYFTSFLVGME